LTDSQPISIAHLEKLNSEQRRAVEYGVQANDVVPGPPLLVIAGAGSGKTNTLAHRVAHLIINGADPRKILLMTFSRRAATEMARRVERIARRVMGDNAAVMTDALWAGTFHGIGARLLRDYAGEIGLDRAFTVHDREDSADLMNLVRHELGFSQTENRFPMKGTCLAVYSRCVNAELAIEDVLATSFPWCSAWAAELKQLFAAYVEANKNRMFSIMMICCSTGRRWSASRALRARWGSASIMCSSMSIKTRTAFNRPSF
jgi:DNA helicase II / ATP-dependent DNA helicase PcrA